MSTVPFTVGDAYTRDQVHAVWGVDKMGGICRSRRNNLIAVFSRPGQLALPEKRKDNGYVFDGWAADRSVYSLTGQGRSGDQTMTGNNRSLLDADELGLAIYLFVTDGVFPGTGTGRQVYAGEFQLASPSHSFDRAAGADGVDREVIVFHFDPVDAAAWDDAYTAPIESESAAATATHVPLEAFRTPSFVTPATSGGVASRAETKLVDEFVRARSRAGAVFNRVKITPPGQRGALFTDLFDTASGTLYEAKASSRRESVRYALGQVLDYRRFIDDCYAAAVLLPDRPADDLVSLLASFDVDVVWRLNASRFESAASGVL